MTALTAERPRTGAGRDSMVRANVVVAAGTALSRLTGFARFALFGVIFGRAALWDAYNAANNTPNMVYELLLGGVLSATLVPVFTRFFADQDDEAAAAVVGTSMVVVGGLMVAAVVGAPLIFRLSAIKVSNAVDAGDYRWLGTALARVFLIQIFFYGLSALWGALLNAKRRFFAPAWAPILSNIAIVVSLLWAKSRLPAGQDGFIEALENPGFRRILAIGATLGVSLQAAALYPAMKRAGIHVRFRADFHHPAVRTVFRLSGWTIGFAACNIVAAQVVQNLAEPGSGNASAYSLAFTFFQLPHALLAMSILTTFVPDLAGYVKRGDRRGFVRRMTLGIRLVGLVTIPAGFGLFVLRRPIVGALLEHGRFDALDALVTSRALAGFALGLGGFSLYLFVLRGFYSHQDTKTAFTLNLFENLINIVLAFALVGRYDVLGLGAAFGIAYVVSAIWAMTVLQHKVGGFDLPQLARDLSKMVAAAVAMALTVWLTQKVVGSNHGVGAWVRILAGFVVGPVMYLAVLMSLGPVMGRPRRAGGPAR